MKRLAFIAALMLSGTVCPAWADREADDAGIAMFGDGRFAEAYQDWRQAAETGDGRAARFLGVLYDTGEGVPQDRAKALAWYRRAAELGDPAGMFNVAVSLDSGTGAVRDKEQAAHWYRLAAARHFGRAEYDLALMYEAGDGIRRDPHAAARLFRAAAGHGIAAAADHLPKTQRVLLGTPLPDDGAMFLTAERALLSRTPEAAASAVSLFKQAILRGGATGQMAQYDLAWCYENGIGVPADKSQAYELYLRVAVATDDPALRDLAETGAAGARGLTDQAPAAVHPAAEARPRHSARSLD